MQLDPSGKTLRISFKSLARGEGPLSQDFGLTMKKWSVLLRAVFGPY